MVTHYGNSACEGSSPYQLNIAAPAAVSKKRSNFRIRQFYEKRHFNIAANLTLNTMVSFIIGASLSEPLLVGASLSEPLLDELAGALFWYIC